ncbi:MAG: FdhD protein [Arenicella sp.]
MRALLKNNWGWQTLKAKKRSHKVSEQSTLDKPIDGVEERLVVLRHSEHLQSSTADYVAQEVPIAFAYNGESHAVMMASPIDLNDFAIGFSLTERIIDKTDDIRAIEIKQASQGITVNIQIKPALMGRLEGKRRQLSGRSGCGICGITDLAAALPIIEPLSDTLLPSHVVIDRAVETLKENQKLQDQCGAVHCAGLFNANGDLLALREDVGRHNALDKLIGSQVKLLQHDFFIGMSSRASHELVAKVAISGIHTLVTISAATSLAIDLAEKTNLNLIGFVRDKRQIIYAS